MFAGDNRLLTADVVVFLVARRGQRLGTVDRHYRRAAVGQAPVRGRQVLVGTAHRHHQQAAVLPVARRARGPRRRAVAVLFPYHLGLGQRHPAVVRRPAGAQTLAHTAASRRRMPGLVLVGVVRLLLRRLHSLGNHLS